MPSPSRYQIRKALGGWYVEDTTTGTVWAGLAHAGAVALASHLNQRPHDRKTS